MAQSSQMNAKEKLGREIDLTNASKDELIEHLCKIIEYEVEKGEDADYDLVRECSDWLDELTEDEVTFTPEELERKLAQLKAGSESKKPVKICKKAKLKTFVRVALIAAVIFAISLVSLSAVAMNKGYGSAWEYISVNIDRILALDTGRELKDNGILIIRADDITHYDNIYDWIKNENLNILVPKAFPDDATITRVNLTVYDKDKCIWSFVFSDASYVLNVTNYYSTNLFLVDESNVIVNNDIKFYVSQKEGTVFHAVCQYNGFEYTIQTSNYDSLLFIISNMKG